MPTEDAAKADERNRTADPFITTAGLPRREAMEGLSASTIGLVGASILLAPQAHGRSKLLKKLVVVSALAAALVAGCGGGSDDTEGTDSSVAGGDSLMACLLDAGFVEPDSEVATVVVDETETVGTVEVPPPDDGNFVVVYAAPSEAVAEKAEKEFAGGPFIKRVGNLLYADTGNVLDEQQKDAIEACLRG